MKDGLYKAIGQVRNVRKSTGSYAENDSGGREGETSHGRPRGQLRGRTPVLRADASKAGG